MMAPEPLLACEAVLAEAQDNDRPALTARALQALVRHGHGTLPLPGRGQTLQRWQRLAGVAQRDLSLAKLYEGHTDALAILAELGGPTPPRDSLWGVWAAEDPAGRTLCEPVGGEEGALVLRGAKCWCSGAGSVDHALLTAWGPDASAPQLVAVAMDQPGITVHDGGWQSIGMAGCPARTVHFDGARAQAVGAPGAYLTRPGFWHGGAGVAACWYGGAEGLAESLYAALARPGRPPTALQLAAAGAVDVQVTQMRAVLAQAAQWIDDHPRDDAAVVAMRVRLAVEEGASQLLDVVARALGAGPFCRDGRFARAAADLPVFLRQSHAERDQAAHAERVLRQWDGRLAPWTP